MGITQLKKYNTTILENLSSIVYNWLVLEMSRMAIKMKNDNK